MKILMICTVELAKNGIASCIINYCSNMCGEDMQIDIVAPNKVDRDIRNLLDERYVRLYEIERKAQPIQYFLQLEKLIKREKYDIVHAHGNSATLEIEMLAAKIGGCRHRIAHSHNTTCKHMTVHKILMPFFSHDYTVGIACGEAAGKWLFGSKKFYVANNGIDVNKFSFSERTRKQIREEYQWEDKIVLGHVGVFNYQKNHEFFVTLLKNLIQKNDKYFLVLVGDGENRENIRTMMETEHLEKHVYFAGNTGNVSEWLQGMDCFLLPSRFEGLPYVLVEAQAAGLPCIISDRISKEAAITPLVEFEGIEDVKKWSRHIADKRWNYDRKELSENAADLLIANHFSIRENAEWLKQLYKKLIQGE